jgi:two-component system chemotaxis response regulator CheY
VALNVLIVDDSSVMRSIIRRALTMTGFEFGEVIEASNGQEGLDALGSHWVDFALVDINMPVMNGEEMIQRMRAMPEAANLPVIVVSTEGSLTRIERLEQQGAKFVHKPFTPEAIRGIIQELTGACHEPTS